MLNKLYRTSIQPCLDYAISVWGHGSQSNRLLIQRMQHKAARIVMGNFDYINTRGEDLVKQLGWQTAEQRRTYFIATLMHKCINGAAPVRLMDELVMSADTHVIPTRLAANGNVHIPEPKCELYRNSFRYQGATTWNSLPSQLKNLQDINEFKYMYKRIYFT